MSISVGHRLEGDAQVGRQPPQNPDSIHTAKETKSDLEIWE